MGQKPKARLTIEQHQRAINEAVHIDASPHEWPKEDTIPLLCNCIIDSVQMVDYLVEENRALRAHVERLEKGLRVARELTREEPDIYVVGIRRVIDELIAATPAQSLEAVTAPLRAHVERLVGALRKIAGPPNEPDADGLIEDSTCTYCEQWADEGCHEDCPRTIATEVLATSPLSGQPLQKVQQFDWRPIAEAPRDHTAIIEAAKAGTTFVRVVQWDSSDGGCWYLTGSKGSSYYPLSAFDVFRPVPTVPMPPEPEVG